MTVQTNHADDILIIDAHHHLWDLGKLHYPWLSHWNPGTFMGNYRPLMKNYLPEDYRADSIGYRVLATVHCEADCDDTDRLAETHWLHQIAAASGMPGVVVAHTWFHLPSCEETLAQHCAYPLTRGIRSKPVTAATPDAMSMVKGAPGSMQDERWLRGFALLEKFGLSWDLRVPYWHLAEAAEVARAFPRTPIVLNHMGFPWDRSVRGLSAWREGMQALALCPNVYVKVSELGGAGLLWTVDNHREVILETTEMFGMERCMFASNFPVARLQISYAQLVNNLADILSPYNREQQEAFFWRNAQSFYRIALPV